MIRSTIRNYGKEIIGIRFLMGLLSVFLLLQLDTEIPLSFDTYRWNALRESSDFKIMITSITYYGMYLAMLCIAATIGFGTRFHEEWKAGIVPQVVQKMGMKTYTCFYTLGAFLSGGLIAAGGFLLFAVYIRQHMKFINLNAAQVDTHEFMYAFTMADETGLQYVFVVSLLLFFTGGLSAVIALCVSTISDNKYLVILSAYLCYRVYVEFCKLVGMPSKLRIDFYLLGRQDIGSSFGEFMGIMIVLIVFTIGVGQYLFRKGVRRRLAYGKY